MPADAAPAPARRRPTVSARIGRVVLQAAAARGVDPRRLAADAGVPAGAADDPDARLPLVVEHRLWTLAAERSGDADFGLHAAASPRAGAYDVLDWAVRTAPTLHEALQRLVRYNRLLHDVALFSLADDDATGRTTLSHRFRPGAGMPPRQASEFTLASVVAVGAQLAGRPLRPLGVEFMHAAPASTAAHEALFGRRPVFGAEANRLVFSRAALAAPVQGADAGLSRIVSAHAEQALAAQAPADATRDTPHDAAALRRWIEQVLPAGGATLDAAARHLGTSARSLQRRLAAAGSGFAGELDAVRHALALRHVDERRLALGEVAYLLGFSEPRAFQRAFRRWTGITPAAARRAGLQATGSPASSASTADATAAGASTCG